MLLNGSPKKSYQFLLPLWQTENAHFFKRVFIDYVNGLKSSLLLVSTPFAMWLCSSLLLCPGHNSMLQNLNMWTFSGQWDIHSNDTWRVLESAYMSGLALLHLCHHCEKIQASPLVSGEGWETSTAKPHKRCDWVQ